MAAGTDVNSVERLDCNNTYITCTRADLLSKNECMELFNLLRHHFKNESKKQIPFSTSHDLSQLYVFRLYDGEQLIASRQMRIVTDPLALSVPDWVSRMANTLSVKTFAIGSRAIVHPDFRKRGYGTMLVESINQDVFRHHQIAAIFGYTTNLTALSLYLKLGAGIWCPDIERLPVRAAIADKYAVLRQLITVRQFKKLPFNYPVHYVYRHPYFKNGFSTPHWSRYLWYAKP